ncbi:MAG TPA: hypothetical protein DCY13_17815 [Verrucomicrobiales bacterium]|nr:hypothetical protein [Verrucomicrobiales bacterium]
MPITCPVRLSPVTDAHFEAVDRVVMVCAYASQHRLGRLCDELVYENDLAARLRAEGTSQVLTQVPIVVSHERFTKEYRLDLVVDGVVYELKVVQALAPAHDAQVFHYGALLNLDRIKLLNFGAAKVEGLLRRCPFPRTDRFAVTINRSHWKPLTAECDALARSMEGCLREWGGFLDCHLLEEALVFLNGGEAECLLRLPVTRDGIQLGSHRVAMHSEEIGFVVTSLGDGLTAQETHLRQLLDALPLRAWQWINLHRLEVRMVTLMK